MYNYLIFSPHHAARKVSSSPEEIIDITNKLIDHGLKYGKESIANSFLSKETVCLYDGRIVVACAVLYNLLGDVSGRWLLTAENGENWNKDFLVVETRNIPESWNIVK